MRRTVIAYPCLLAVLASLSSGCCWQFADTCCRPAWRPFLLRPACAPSCGPAGCPAPGLAAGPVFDGGFADVGYGPPPVVRRPGLRPRARDRRRRPGVFDV